MERKIVKHRSFRGDSLFTENVMKSINKFISGIKITPDRLINIVITRLDGDIIYDLIYWSEK